MVTSIEKVSSNAYSLGLQIIRYASHVESGYYLADLSLKKIEVLLKSLDVADYEYYLKLLRDIEVNEFIWEQAREIAVHLGTILSVNWTRDIGDLCEFGCFLPLFAVSLRSGGNRRTLNIATGELEHCFQDLQGVLPLEVTKELTGILKNSYAVEPRSSEAVDLSEKVVAIYERLDVLLERSGRKSGISFDTKKVFVVHGHDESMKYSVANFLQRIGLEPIILHEQPNRGQAILEKFENEAQSAGFAVVLFSPDDVIQSTDSLVSRARPNVIFELGYFTGTLGRNRTCVLYKDGVEIPSDYAGILYIPYDNSDGWKAKLAREMRIAGMQFDLELVL